MIVPSGRSPLFFFQTMRLCDPSFSGVHSPVGLNDRAEARCNGKPSRGCLQGAHPEESRNRPRCLMLGRSELGRADLHALRRRAHRGEQMAFLAGLHHDRATEPHIGELLAVLAGSELTTDPESVQAVNIREITRSYERHRLLPRLLVEEIARTTSLAQQEWIAAREENNYPRFRHWLDRIVGLKKEEARCLLPATASSGEPATTPYDSLLDTYEPGARTSDLTLLFADLRSELWSRRDDRFRGRSNGCEFPGQSLLSHRPAAGLW